MRRNTWLKFKIYKTVTYIFIGILLFILGSFIMNHYEFKSQNQDFIVIDPTSGNLTEIGYTNMGIDANNNYNYQYKVTQEADNRIVYHRYYPSECIVTKTNTISKTGNCDSIDDMFLDIYKFYSD